jgi:hypothetical protein
LNRVLFPDPEGPMMERYSPAWICRSTPRSASTLCFLSLKTLVTPETLPILWDFDMATRYPRPLSLLIWSAFSSSNPNIEYRNTKQIRISKTQMTETSLLRSIPHCFEHLKIWILDLFRNWGPARRVGSPQDQFRASDFEFSTLPFQLIRPLRQAHRKR